MTIEILNADVASAARAIPDAEAALERAKQTHREKLERRERLRGLATFVAGKNASEIQALIERRDSEAKDFLKQRESSSVAHLTDPRSPNHAEEMVYLRGLLSPRVAE